MAALSVGLLPRENPAHRRADTPTSQISLCTAVLLRKERERNEGMRLLANMRTKGAPFCTSCRAAAAPVHPWRRRRPIICADPHGRVRQEHAFWQKCHATG